MFLRDKHLPLYDATDAVSYGESQPRGILISNCARNESWTCALLRITSRIHSRVFVSHAISQGLLQEQARDADRSGESIARNRHYPLKGGITINNGVLHLKICVKSRILEDIIKRKVSGSRKYFIIALTSLSHSPCRYVERFLKIYCSHNKSNNKFTMFCYKCCRGSLHLRGERKYVSQNFEKPKRF